MNNKWNYIFVSKLCNVREFLTILYTLYNNNITISMYNKRQIINQYWYKFRFS